MKILRFLRRELLQIVLLVLPFALAALWWGRMPPRVVTHWNIHGQPNGWMPRATGVLLAPVLNVGLCLLLAWLPLIDPRLRRAPAVGTAHDRQTLRWSRYAVTAFLAFVAVAVIAVAAGWHLDMVALVNRALLVMLAILGNFFSRLQPNYFIGVRTPWTLGDPATWRATHRVAGRLLVAGSVTLLVGGCFVSSQVQTYLLLGFLVALAGWSLGYSAWFFRRQRPSSAAV